MTRVAHPVPRIDALQFVAPSRAVFEEMRAGGVDAVHITVSYHEGFRDTVGALAAWNRQFQDHGDLILRGTSAADIDHARATGRTAIFFGAQNPAPIEDDIGLVEILHQLGLRFMQLSYNNQSLLCSGCYEAEDTGLTNMGREVVTEMNRVGLVIDMSHSGDRSRREAIDASARPIAITHANPADWHDVPRNVRADTIAALAARGGMLGFSLYPLHLAGGSDCTLEALTAMIARVADQVGTAALGIGSDLCQGQPDSALAWMRDGRWRKTGGGAVQFPEPPKFFQSNSQFPGLAEGLRARGFDAADTDAILGGNWYRFFSESFEPA
ncbi:MAG: membrane dipeptidase [Pseudomonadota bacterium]